MVDNVTLPANLPAVVTPVVSPTREMVAVLDVAQARDLLKRLSDGQRRFLRLRFLHDSDAAAAVAAGSTAQAVKNWKKNAEFVEAYNRILIDPILHASAELALIAPEAAGVLQDVLLNGRDADRLRAAEQVLRSKPVQLVGPATLKVEGGEGAGAVSYARLLYELRRVKNMSVEGLVPDGEVIEGEVRVIDMQPAS